MKILRATILLATLLPGVATADGLFYQGPGKINGRLEAHGTVIGPAPGLKVGCYLMLAKRENNEIPGGAGRFFLCLERPNLAVGQNWAGSVIQVDRQLSRVGPKWRPLPVFEPIN